VEVVQRHSYGRQLGRMADALEALIEERGEGTSSDQRFTEFTTVKQEIDEIKLDAAATRIGQLLADLAMLTAAAGPSTAGCAMHCDARSTNDAARLMAMRSIASVHIQAAPQNSAILCLRAGPVSRLSAPIQHVASRRITAPSLATSLSRAVTVQGKAAQGVVSWCGWHGMQEVRVQVPSAPPGTRRGGGGGSRG
jgi:hypothetical protein